MTPPRIIGLEDLIVTSRRALELRLATDDELIGITGEVKDDIALRGHLRSWRVIAIADPASGSTSFHVTGFLSALPWITWPVDLIASDRSLVRTTNSLYSLQEDPGSGLSPHHLQVAALGLTCWGIADAYGLGLMDDIDIDKAFEGRHES